MKVQCVKRPTNACFRCSNERKQRTYSVCNSIAAAIVATGLAVLIFFILSGQLLLTNDDKNNNSSSSSSRNRSRNFNNDTQQTVVDSSSTGSPSSPPVQAPPPENTSPAEETATTSAPVKSPGFETEDDDDDEDSSLNAEQPTALPTVLVVPPPPTSAPSVLPQITNTAEPTTAAPVTDIPTTNSPSATPSTQSPTPLPSWVVKPTVSPTLSSAIPLTDSPTRTPTGSPTDSPTMSPTQAPTLSPAIPLTDSPTRTPTKGPTESPTLFPTKAPTRSPTTDAPTEFPTFLPTKAPTKFPTNAPTKAQTRSPTFLPTKAPVIPTPSPTAAPIVPGTSTTFYAVGDAPYSARQAIRLEQQMVDLPLDAEFLVHVGDIRDADGDKTCYRNEYREAADILKKSHAPVFVILGDNDWTDCDNQDQALRWWKQEFVGFESKHWSHNFNIMRMDGYPDNFAFRHKGTLFIGLNIIGGPVQDEQEWETRLTSEAEWTIGHIRDYKTEMDAISQQNAQVVIFGHANPGGDHDDFFDPLTEFMEDELQDEIPILYINGDRHDWKYEGNFMDVKSFLRIMVAGKADEPPVKIVVDSKRSVQAANQGNAAGGGPRNPRKVFVHDRFPY